MIAQFKSRLQYCEAIEGVAREGESRRPGDTQEDGSLGGMDARETEIRRGIRVGWEEVLRLGVRYIPGHHRRRRDAAGTPRGRAAAALLRPVGGHDGADEQHREDAAGQPRQRRDTRLARENRPSGNERKERQQSRKRFHHTLEEQVKHRGHYSTISVSNRREHFMFPWFLGNGHERKRFTLEE